ncbi:MAG: biotin carboxylase [Actinomycetia bacterium]|nr:biotin carboxylase [Actinomycetes bacterium]
MAKKKRKNKKGKRKKHLRAGRPPRRLDKTMSNVGTGSTKKPTKTQKAKATRARRKPEGPVLRSLSDIYQYFRENTSPVYFISPTSYNLLGIDEWIGSFRYITYFDSFHGGHSRSFSPTHAGPRDFESFESVNSYLLGNKEVIDFIKKNGPGKALFVMFDEETQDFANQLGLEIALPPRELREKIDSKIVTTQLGNEAGVASVPNVMGKADTYKKLRKLAKSADLGEDLVVQTPYGDSGRTTFFISSEDDFLENEDVLTDTEIKVMKRINHFPGTVEACATRHGTLVGPIQTDITGFPELTPYRGGWCGNDVFPGVFTEDVRKQIGRMARRLGERLYEIGYKGVFCLDFLVDDDDGSVYLGEINPRISGASPLTNLITSRYGGIPLFLFHMLEFSDVDWEIDIDAVQKRWRDFDRWTQLVLKQVTDDVELVTAAPRSGLWRMSDDGKISYVHEETDWHNVSDDAEAFYMQVYGEGEYRYPGADLGVLVTRDRMQTDSRELLTRGSKWAKAIGEQFHGIPPEGRVIMPEELLYAKWF